MNMFVIADTHFGHEGVIKFSNRPWKTVEEMNEALIENWNKKVGKKDHVFIVGDFAWTRHGYFINALNGKKELITGSHDKMPQKYLSCFSWVGNVKSTRIMNRDFIMQHCCPRIWEKSHYGSVALYAHSHGRLKTYNLSFDVGVDVPENRYAPISFEEIMERVSVREAQMRKEGRIQEEERERNGKKSKCTIYYQDDLAFFDQDRARNKGSY